MLNFQKITGSDGELEGIWGLQALQAPIKTRGTPGCLDIQEPPLPWWGGGTALGCDRSTSLPGGLAGGWQGQQVAGGGNQPCLARGGSTPHSKVVLSPSLQAGWGQEPVAWVSMCEMRQVWAHAGSYTEHESTVWCSCKKGILGCIYRNVIAEAWKVIMPCYQLVTTPQLCSRAHVWEQYSKE